MKRVQGAMILLVALTVAAWQATAVQAQTAKTARGTVTAVSGDSLTVKVGEKDMQFTVDSKTTVIAPGASTKTKQAAAKGAAGVTITDVVSVGKPVEVHYTESGGSNHASSVRAIASAGAGGGGVSEKTMSKTASGTVKSIAGTSLTIDHSGKDMNFTIDTNTKVVGKGAGTKAQSAGGRTSITDLVGNGDNVSVTYTEAGGSMVASTVRVNAKGTK
jgi:uncharacterized protein DUF5666